MKNAKNILITGATDGIGTLTAQALAKLNHNIYIHGRSPKKIAETISKVKAESGNNNIYSYQADLASFSEIKSMAQKIKEDNLLIDVLINNAGMAGGKERRESKDGLEVCFQVNYLATFLLTHLLLPHIKERIVNVSSLGQYHIDFDDVMLEKEYDGIRAYRQSKLAMIMFTFELARNINDLIVTSLHPGSMLNTKIAQEMFGTARGNANEGIKPIVSLALEQGDIHGKFFNGTAEAKALPQAYDEESCKNLWNLSKDLVGDFL
ncbi:SDR family NAD(P)-dependent oxidoreductase [Candidatus Uabimicrobium sp. HlEnr_7]|uniref:SDR family NAD(P)-dependent oxidoreductase n=1 Tax=Candidatus Uabimicrobium helgolandensis TaxID=3095367 RepID=UPI0035568948